MSNNFQQTQSSQQTQPKVVAAIPCFNEERFIGSVVAKAKRYVDTVVVIDDGSTDDSAEIAEQVGAAVYRSEHGGYGAAIGAALEAGRDAGADILVTLDGDGQHDPAEIPRLIEPITAGQADIVVGSRFLANQSTAPLYRRVGQQVLTFASNLASGEKISDSQSGYRAYSTRALQELVVSEAGMSVGSQLQFAARQAGLRVAEIPISVTYADGVKRNPVAHGFGVLGRIAVMFALDRPLLLFGVTGTVLLLAGLVLGFWVLAKYQGTGAVPIPAAWAALTLAIGGLVIGLSGLTLQAMREVIARELAQIVKRLRQKEKE